MSSLLASKVIIAEEPPRVRGVPSVSTSVAGAVGVIERGPIGVPVLVTSFEEYERHFGGFTRTSNLALAAMGFFENGGGHLWVVRTAHYADPTDAATVTARASMGTLLATPAEPALVDGEPGEAPAEGAEAPEAPADPEEPIAEDPEAPAPDEPPVGEPVPVPTLTVRGKTPGTYADRVEIEVKAGSDPATFNLSVIEDGVYREVFRDLSADPSSPRFVEAIVNHPRTGSTLIAVEDLATGLPPDPQVVALTGGSDGLEGLNDADFVGSPTSKTGLHALDTIQDLSLLLVPGRATPAVHQAMVAYCELERSGLVFAILDPPAAQSATDIITYVVDTAGLANLSEHAAIYWPRLEVLNPSRAVFGTAERVTVPPSGIVAGVYARTDASRPGGVYEPPAGIDQGRMVGVLGFETAEVLEEKKRDLVYPKRINPLTTGPGLPRFIDGSRTLKGDGAFAYIAERRGVSFIERSLKQGLEFARHRNNTEGLRAQVRRTITAFLMTQLNNGAFRSRDPSKAFFVDVSDALNTPTTIFAGKLIARVGLATNKPAEFIVVTLSAGTRAMDAELAAGT